MPGKTRTENTQDLWGMKLHERWASKWPDLRVCRVHTRDVSSEYHIEQRMNDGYRPLEVPDDEKLLLSGGVNYQLFGKPLEDWKRDEAGRMNLSYIKQNHEEDIGFAGQSDD